MSSDDPLSNEVSLKASVQEKALSIQSKSRAVAAIDRLIGSILDIPTAYLEHIAKSVRVRGELDLRAIQQNNLEDLSQETQKQVIEAIQDAVRPRQAKKLANKKAIVEKSIEHLESYETPDEGDEMLDDDWLNYFEQYAENATSERMQDLWARVLAGEIRKPKTFSLASIRFLSELDKEIAELFETECKNRSADGFIVKPREMRGKKLLDLTFLEEVGLLQEVNGPINKTLEPQTDEKLYFRESNTLLIMEPISGKKVNVPLIRITRIGREVARLLPKAESTAFLEEIFASVSDKVSSAKIHIIAETPGNGELRIVPLKELKSAHDAG